MKLQYIVILGFAESCPEANRRIAFKLGQYLASKNLAIAGGNLLGTPQYAFQGAKLCNGSSFAIIKKIIF